MKRKFTLLAAGAVLITAFVGSAYAADKAVKVYVNNWLLQSAVPPSIVDGKVMVPLREVAESLGATVKWNNDSQSVEVEMPQARSLQMQVQLLENAVAPKSPEEAVETWARAVQTRNGALQYAVMAPRLKELERKSFEAFHWVSGVSSPWVEKYKIEPIRTEEDGSRTFGVRFDWRTSMDINAPEHWEDIKPYPVVVQKDGDNWYISRFPTAWMKQKLVLPDGQTFAEEDGFYHGANLQLQFQGVGIAANARSAALAAAGNHAEVLSEEQVTLPLGPAILAEVERTPPAASGMQTAKAELWLIVVRDSPEDQDRKRAYCLTGIVTGDKEAAKKELLEAGQTWKLLGE
ncbi:copper amine oxidase N-terminal domain-containing protein [Paenibacillus hamazuiensis]|uniref:copper amine oxidase N-terminal domain-containing protein n=1 Tax=Paenibacillus hamazuiensis TaxID=2936508 RepID=UPI00200E9AF0|nr:copper amine oxidase N-terminal domain-containing protein [Paenibacillus hamazuiensis]